MTTNIEKNLLMHANRLDETADLLRLAADTLASKRGAPQRKSTDTPDDDVGHAFEGFPNTRWAREAFNQAVREKRVRRSGLLDDMANAAMETEGYVLAKRPEGEGCTDHEGCEAPSINCGFDLAGPGGNTEEGSDDLTELRRWAIQIALKAVVESSPLPKTTREIVVAAEEIERYVLGNWSAGEGGLDPEDVQDAAMKTLDDLCGPSMSDLVRDGLGDQADPVRGAHPDDIRRG